MIHNIDGKVMTGPGAVRTPIWDKAQAADVSAYQDTIYASPLAKFVAHMVNEGHESQHTPELIARQAIHPSRVIAIRSKKCKASDCHITC